MKKILIIAALLLFVSAPSFAEIGADSTGNLTIGGGTTAAGVESDTLTCGLSSNVHAYYDNDGATSTQWYVIGTYHIGGTEVFATAQDITALYKLANGKVPGDEFSWSGLPADASASSEWSGTVWQQL
jgi:hypothetical protein